LGSEGQESWNEKFKEALDEYEKKKIAFENSPAYKRYKAEISGGSAVKQTGPPPPVPPSNMPKRPEGSFAMFKKVTLGDAKEVHKKWMDLGAEGQKEWAEKSKEAMETYEEDLAEFNKTAEAKRYYRLKAIYEQKQKESKTRGRFMNDPSIPKEPRKPMSAYFVFMGDKRAEIAARLGSEGNLKAVSAELLKTWQGLAPEEKKVYEDKVEEQKKVYEEELRKYKSHPAVIKMESALAALKNQGAQAKAKAFAGRGGKGAGRGRGSAQSSDSGSDVMGSDSDDAKSSKSSKSNKSNKSKKSNQSKKSASSKSSSKSSKSSNSSD